MSRTARTLPAIAAAAAAALVLVTAAPATAHPGAGQPGPGRAGVVETIPLPDRSSPEGIAGGTGSTFYAGSRADGSIVRGNLRTGTTAPFVAGRTGAVAVGMQLDQRTGLLWVAGGGTGTVTAYDGRTGAVRAAYTAPAAANGRFLNDVEVTADGVFVTDSLNAELVVVRTPSKQALPSGVELLPLTGDFVQQDGFTANGIRELPGGDLLVVAQGALQRIDPRTGVATRLVQTGGEALTGGDGLERRGNTLYVVYGFGRDSVAEVRLQHGARSFSVTGELTDADLDRPTTATLQGGALFAVNGKFTDPTATTFEVVRVALR